MKVTEIFYSLQGEGRLAGVPSVFVRLAGCPVRCAWCDTPYAWRSDQGTDYTVGQIVQVVEQWDCRCTVITGGEPLVNEDWTPRQGLKELAECLGRVGRRITIETAGGVFVPDLACDLMSISPKLPHARIDGQGGANVLALKQLTRHYRYQLKFVVDGPEDVVPIREILKGLGDVDPHQVLLMPQARTPQEMADKAPMVAELCKKTGFVFGPRLQIWLWGQHRGR